MNTSHGRSRNYLPIICERTKKRFGQISLQCLGQWSKFLTLLLAFIPVYLQGATKQIPYATEFEGDLLGPYVELVGWNGGGEIAKLEGWTSRGLLLKNDHPPCYIDFANLPQTGVLYVDMMVQCNITGNSCNIFSFNGVNLTAESVSLFAKDALYGDSQLFRFTSGLNTTGYTKSFWRTINISPSQPLWRRITLEMDLTSQTYSVYVDGYRQVSEAHFRKGVTAEQKRLAFSAKGFAQGNWIGVDRLSVTTTRPKDLYASKPKTLPYYEDFRRDWMTDMEIHQVIEKRGWDTRVVRLSPLKADSIHCGQFVEKESDPTRPCGLTLWGSHYSLSQTFSNLPSEQTVEVEFGLSFPGRSDLYPDPYLHPGLDLEDTSFAREVTVEDCLIFEFNGIRFAIKDRLYVWDCTENPSGEWRRADFSLNMSWGTVRIKFNNKLKSCTLSIGECPDITFQYMPASGTTKMSFFGTPQWIEISEISVRKEGDSSKPPVDPEDPDNYITYPEEPEPDPEPEPQVNPHYPLWWYGGGDSVQRMILPGTDSSTESNYAPLNLGQLKWTAIQAKRYLDIQLAELGGAKIDLKALFPSMPPKGGAGSVERATYDAAMETNYAPALLGQLKAVAKPFYDRLQAVGYDTNAYLKGKGYAEDWTHAYPWNPSVSVEANYVLANLGQLKLVFGFDLINHILPPPEDIVSFDPYQDSDGDGIPDWWERILGSDPNVADADNTAEGTNKTYRERYEDLIGGRLDPAASSLNNPMLNILTPTL